MYFYETWVASHRYHGQTALTYSHDAPLEIGTIVLVPLGKNPALGIVASVVKKPSFAFISKL